MTAIEVAVKVCAEKQCHLFRPRIGEPGQYDAKAWGNGSKRGWVALDLWTASHIVAVDKALLNQEQKAKFRGLELRKMAILALRIAAKVS